MANLFTSIFGGDEADRLMENKVRESADIQENLHQWNPNLPAAKDTAPAPHSDFLSDISFGVLGNNNSNLIRAHKDEVAKLSQASDQGRLDYNQFLTRVSAVTSKYSSIDPENAATYQAVGARTLGFNSTNKLLSAADEAQQAVINTQQSITNAYAAKAADTGAWTPGSGPPDIQQLAALGQTITAQEYQLKRDQLAREAAAVPADQRHDAEAAALRRNIQPVFGQMLDMQRKTMSDVLAKNPGMSEADQQILLSRGTAESEQGWQAWFQKYAADNNISPSVAEDMQKEHEHFYQSVIQPITGDLSSYKTWDRALNEAKARIGLNAVQTMPSIAMIKEAAGDAAGAAAFTTALNSNQGARTAFDKNVGAQVNAWASMNNPLQSLDHSSQVMNGSRDVSQMTPDEQQKAIPVLLASLQTQANDPQSLTPDHIDNWGRGTVNLLSYTRNVTDKDMLKNAALQLASPKMAAMLTTLSAQDPGSAKYIAGQMNDLGIRAFLAHAQDYRPVTDKAMGNHGIVNDSIVYNPQSNKFEVNHSYKLNPGAERLHDPEDIDMGPDPYMARYAATMNQLAATVNNTKDMAGTRMSKLNPTQVNQALADVTGINTKPGVVKTEYDPALMSGLGVTDAINQAEAAAPINITPGMDIKELVNQIATSTNIPPAMARALIRQESNYKINARSKTGAQGLGQLTSIFIKQYGGTDDPSTPQGNVTIALRGLKDLKNRYGTWREALKHYGDPNQTGYADEVLAKYAEEQLAESE